MGGDNISSIESDFLKIIFELSNKETSKGLYPHKKTIINIFKGNKYSSNAMRFHSSEYFSRYPYFNSIIFEELLLKYKKKYLTVIIKNKKKRYYASKELCKFLKLLNHENDNLDNLSTNEKFTVESLLDDFFN